MVTGNKDSAARDWLYEDTDALQDRRCEVKHFLFSGGHEMAPLEITDACIQWLEKDWKRHGSKRDPPSKKQGKDLERVVQKSSLFEPVQILEGVPSRAFQKQNGFTAIDSFSEGETMNCISKSPSETWRIATEFFQTLEIPVVIALHGNLGVGKTCFTQGLAQAAGVCEPVCSPTYTLISEYQGDIPFHHIDLYRLSGPQDAVELGFDEYLESDGLTVIEWAERATALIPPGAIHVRLAHVEEEQFRSIDIVENPFVEKY